MHTVLSCFIAIPSVPGNWKVGCLHTAWAAGLTAQWMPTLSLVVLLQRNKVCCLLLLLLLLPKGPMFPCHMISEVMALATQARQGVY